MSWDPSIHSSRLLANLFCVLPGWSLSCLSKSYETNQSRRTSLRNWRNRMGMCVDVRSNVTGRPSVCLPHSRRGSDCLLFRTPVDACVVWNLRNGTFDIPSPHSIRHCLSNARGCFHCPDRVCPLLLHPCSVHYDCARSAVDVSIFHSFGSVCPGTRDSIVCVVALMFHDLPLVSRNSRSSSSTDSVISQ